MGRVVFENVTKLFNQDGRTPVVAVDRANLEIADGEFMVLVGPSGCGKSTSLRMIAGLERPTEGRIFIGERDVTHLHPRVRNIAMVFQDYALYPHMTVYQNMSFALKNLKYDKAEIARRIKATVDMLGIANLLDRRPKELSGGQRQRVALGRAIVRNPEVFLLDEPLSNLDAKLHVHMRVELAGLQRRLGVTMVYVTHDQEEAMTLGHRIVVMKDGRIQQVAPPEELYRSPRNTFVAQFIGSPAMNLISGVVEPEADCLYFRDQEGKFRIALPAIFRNGLERYAGKSVYLGIRPEDIKAGSSSTSANDISVPVDVATAELLGPHRLAYFRIGASLVVASLDPDIAVRAGERLNTCWAGRKLHFFDVESEERIELPMPDATESDDGAAADV